MRNEKVGFVFQSFNLLPRTPAIKQVMLPMLYSRRKTGAPHGSVPGRAKRWRMWGWATACTTDPTRLSGGQQQRVAIARALINNPPLILADEPTGNLDSHSGQEIMAILHGLHEQGATIVMVTHDPEIAGHASRIICLRDGSVAVGRRGGARDCLERNVGGKE